MQINTSVMGVYMFLNIPTPSAESVPTVCTTHFLLLHIYSPSLSDTLGFTIQMDF